MAHVFGYCFCSHTPTTSFVCTIVRANSKLGATIMWLWSHAHCNASARDVPRMQTRSASLENNTASADTPHTSTQDSARVHTRSVIKTLGAEAVHLHKAATKRRHDKQLTSSRGSPGTGCGRWTGSASPGRTPTSSSKTTSLAQGLHHLRSCSTEGQQHPSCTSSP